MSQQCFECQYWSSANKKGQTHSMAKYGFGLCKHDEDWRYFTANKPCDKERFLTRTNEEIEAIAQWLK